MEQPVEKEKKDNSQEMGLSAEELRDLRNAFGCENVEEQIAEAYGWLAEGIRKDMYLLLFLLILSIGLLLAAIYAAVSFV